MIKIICIGKIKEAYLKDFIDDYKKRIEKYHKINIIELKEEVDLEQEAKIISKHIAPRDYIVVLDRLGNPVDSLTFAKKIEDIFIRHSTITFIIGSSEGISNEIKKEANALISFGNVTFPHGVFRALLLEQIYRAFKINNHETYHK